MARKGLQNRLPTVSFLQAVPRNNEAMSCERRSDGSVLVSVPIQRPKYLVPPISWILPFSSRRRIELEPVGAAVLDLCDGRRTVETIIESFARRYKLTFREAQLGVTEFLRQLAQRGMVVIVGAQKDTEEL